MEEVEPPGCDDEPGGNQAQSPVARCGRSYPRLASNILSGRTHNVFPASDRTQIFRTSFYPGVSEKDWNDWRWQIKHAATSIHELERILRLGDEERAVFLAKEHYFPLSVTPYYMSLLDPHDSGHPLRRSVIPSIDERMKSPGETEDPLKEDEDSPVEGLVHRYPDRVLFLVTDFCSTYCRYCTRSRMVGAHGATGCSRDRWRQAIDYIAEHSEVRDVLLSGGDPLTLSDDRLAWLLGELRAIPHVEIIRIGTKAPVVLPQRITRGLAATLRRFHPLWMSIHFTHPDEITAEVKEACRRLADAGIPLLSQTVLLKGINDDPETLRKLFHELVKMRVRPYYLYQCDPIIGSGHFRTSVARGIEIVKKLRGFTSGFAVPLYVIDAPGGGGKVPIMPEYQLGHDGGDLVMRNYEGNCYRYPDLSSETAYRPVQSNALFEESRQS
ncbi:MAG: KamA family radical SAM protein [Deltaproteobacteria bacterium]|nr:KamA family radical SAM protein [Deltaproteobacteria bacterium]